MPYLQLQLAVHEPQSTTVETFLPFPSTFTATAVRNKIGEGGLQLSVDKNVLNASWLLKPCEIAVRANIGSGGTFAELPGHRYIVLGDEYDLVARAGADAAIRGSVLPIGWLFSTALVYPLSGQKPQDRPYRRFKGRSVGNIMQTLMTEAQSRGALPGITRNWAGVNDAAGRPWNSTYNWTLNVGDTLLDVINKMCADGRCDAIMIGRQLRLYKPGTLGRVPGANTTNGSILRIGNELLNAPRQFDRSVRRTSALVSGQNNIYASGVQNPALATTEWGEWETFLNIDDDKVTDLQNKARSQLNALAAGNYSLSTRLSLKPDGKLPYFHYGLGDWVGIATALLTPDVVPDPHSTFQIEQISLTSDPHGVLTGELQLGKRKSKPIVKTAARVATLEQSARTVAAFSSPGQTGVRVPSTGRGFTAITADSGVIGPGVESIVATLPGVVIEDGRAYEIGVELNVGANSEAARPTFRVRKNVIGGSIYTLWRDAATRINNTAVASGTFVYYSYSRRSILVRTAGLGDETMDLRLSLQNANGAAGSVILKGDTTSGVGYFYIKDIGEDIEYPGVNVLGV